MSLSWLLAYQNLVRGTAARLLRACSFALRQRFGNRRACLHEAASLSWRARVFAALRLWSVSQYAPLAPGPLRLESVAVSRRTQAVRTHGRAVLDGHAHGPGRVGAPASRGAEAPRRQRWGQTKCAKNGRICSWHTRKNEFRSRSLPNAPGQLP